MYQSSSSSSSSSSQRSMASGGLTRYGSAPGSMITRAVDSVIGTNPEILMDHQNHHHRQFFSADSSSSLSTDQSSCKVNGERRSYGLNELTIGNYPTTTNLKIGGGGGGCSPSPSLVRHSSSPAGFLNCSASENGFEATTMELIIKKKKKKTTMEFFPEDIISNILLRLCVKSVCRFRCVCKSWRSLIAEPQFIYKHLHRSSTSIYDGDDATTCISSSQRIIISSMSATALEIECESLPQPIRMREINVTDICKTPYYPRYGVTYLLGSCHGMVGFIDKAKLISVCNLCTGDFRRLPRLKNFAKQYVKFCGIGFESVSNDYKVLVSAITTRDGREGYTTNVFSLKNNSWKTLHNCPSYHFDIVKPRNGVFLNDSLHWLCYREDQALLLSFNFVTDEFQETTLQFPSVSQPFYFRSLFLLRTGLSLSISKPDGSTENEIWVMKEYGVQTSWTKLFEINTSGYRSFVPLCILKSGELVGHVTDGNGDYGFLVDKKDRSCGDVIFQGYLKYICQSIVYIESLVSPNI